MGHPILLYDGMCGLCNRMVRLVLKRDRDGIFRFASLQSPLAAGILAAHGVAPSSLDTFYLVLNHDPVKPAERERPPRELLLVRSDAVLFVLKNLHGIWTVTATVLRVIPRPIRDWVYRLLARHRYRIFGLYATCPMPEEDLRDRFLDV